MGDAGKVEFIIPTRQKADRLFESKALILAGGTFTSPVRRVEGYSLIKFLASSPQSFTLRIQEAVNPKGPWVETHRFNSTLSGDGINQFSCEDVPPCGVFMRVFVDNTSGVNMASFQFLGLGHPI